MDFPSVDIFSNHNCEEDEVKRKAAKVEAFRQGYTPRQCNSEQDFTDDANGLKAKADLEYYLGNYETARGLYLQLMASSQLKGSVVKRDVLEALARTHSVLGDVESAVLYANQILDSTPDHVDFQLVSLNLLLDVLDRAKVTEPPRYLSQYRLTIMRILSLHPNLPRLWLKLSHTFPADKLNCRYSCLLRARAFNVGQPQQAVDTELRLFRATFPAFDCDTFKLKGVNGGSFNGAGESPETEEVGGEFLDLGTSVRRKQIEQALESGERRSDCNSHLDPDNFTQNFVDNWLQD